MTKYLVVLTYRGYSNQLDKAILQSLERRDRRLFGGSGFSFLDGGRELCFDTFKKEIADRLTKNLQKSLKQNHVRGKVKVYKDDNY